jgi:hypothetical protein
MADPNTPQVGNFDLVNAAKGANLNISQLVQAFSSLASSLNGSATQQSFAANGFAKFASGLIINWGTGSTTSGTGTITYSMPFPNACFAVLLTNTGTATATNNNLIASTTPGKTTCSVFGAAAQSLSFFYLAIGN